MKKVKNIKLDERFTGVLFGIILINNSFVDWKISVVLVAGFLFLSARQRSCIMCEVSEKVNNT